MAGAPKGNKNAAKAKIWSDAIRLAVMRDRKQLDKLARALIDKAIEGDVPALKEIGDRLEGKIPQAITGPDNTPLIPPVIHFHRE